MNYDKLYLITIIKVIRKLVRQGVYFNVISIRQFCCAFIDVVQF